MTPPPSTPTPVTMSHPARWLAVLRLLVGCWFAKALWTKMHVVLLGGFVPVLGVQPRWVDVMPRIIGAQMAENPIGWYRGFVEGTVLASPALFAHLTAWGEVLVGVSLTLGLCSGLGALGGLFLSLNYGLATWHMSSSAQGFHFMLVITMTLLFLARSGRALGLDAWIAWRWPGSFLTWRPIS